MTVLDQSKRDAYRFALEDMGVPEVIAFMAARRLTFAVPRSLNNYSASGLVGGFFYWADTKEGRDFWDCVDENCLRLPA